MTIWLEQKRRCEPLTVTDSRMTRYFMSFKDMTTLIIQCVEDMQGGEVFVPTKVKHSSIMEMAHNISDEIKIIGLREGERLQAFLLTDEEKSRAEKKESYWLIKS